MWYTEHVECERNSFFVNNMHFPGIIFAAFLYVGNLVLGWQTLNFRLGTSSIIEINKTFVTCSIVSIEVLLRSLYIKGQMPRSGIYFKHPHYGEIGLK